MKKTSYWPLFSICVFLIAMLSGCGQKGALFFPKPKPPIENKQERIEQQQELESED